MILLCFAVLVAATSAATVCKCEDKKVNETNKVTSRQNNSIINKSIIIDLLLEY